MGVASPDRSVPVARSARTVRRGTCSLYGRTRPGVDRSRWTPRAHARRSEGSTFGFSGKLICGHTPKRLLRVLSRRASALLDKCIIGREDGEEPDRSRIHHFGGVREYGQVGWFPV